MFLLQDVKMERDKFQAQVEQLLEANKHYHEHTEEMTHKMSEIMVCAFKRIECLSELALLQILKSASPLAERKSC